MNYIQAYNMHKQAAASSFKPTRNQLIGAGAGLVSAPLAYLLAKKLGLNTAAALGVGGLAGAGIGYGAYKGADALLRATPTPTPQKGPGIGAKITGAIGSGLATAGGALRDGATAVGNWLADYPKVVGHSTLAGAGVLVGAGSAYNKRRRAAKAIEQFNQAARGTGASPRLVAARDRAAKVLAKKPRYGRRALWGAAATEGLYHLAQLFTGGYDGAIANAQERAGRAGDVLRTGAESVGGYLDDALTAGTRGVFSAGDRLTKYL